MPLEVVCTSSARTAINRCVPAADRRSFDRAVERLAGALCGECLVGELIEGLRAVVVLDRYEVLYLYKPGLSRVVIVEIDFR